MLAKMKYNKSAIKYKFPDDGWFPRRGLERDFKKFFKKLPPLSQLTLQNWNYYQFIMEAIVGFKYLYKDKFTK